MDDAIMGKKNPYYDEEGTGETPLIEELTPEVTPVPTKSEPVSMPAPPVVDKQVESVPVPTVSPIAVPVPTPRLPEVKVALPKKPVKPRVQPEDSGSSKIEEIPAEPVKSAQSQARVPEGFRELDIPMRERSDRTKFQFTAPAPLEIDDDPERAVVSEPEAEANEDKKDKRGNRKKNKVKSTLDTVKINPYDGGRWKVLTLRIGIWAVIGIVILVGAKNVVFPSKPDVTKLATEVGTQIGFNGFPIQTGQSIATSFVKEYLTINPDPNKLAQRTDNIAHLMGISDSNNIPYWVNPSNKVAQQSVIAGPILVKAPILNDPLRVFYIFGAQVVSGKNAPKWVYLSVTMYSKDGVTVVAGKPGFVNAPGLPTDGSAFPYTNSTEKANSFGADLPGFLTAWAASDSVGIERYIQDDATDAVKNGLGGGATFVSFANLRVAAVDEKKPAIAQGSRDAEVDVTWKVNGNLWVQGYSMTIRQASDGKWYIQDIYGGVFGNNQGL